MVKITPLSDINSGFGSAGLHNTNNTRIENAFDNTLSRDGSSPNQMEADIDLNNNDLLNVKQIDADVITLDGVQITAVSTIGAIATQTTDGFMSSEDKTRLDNLVVDNFETKALAEAENIDVPALRIRGYTTSGDKGGGLYKRVASEPFHEGKLQSGSIWYELVPEDGWVNERQFGVIGDGTTDDTAALQNAINYVNHFSAASQAAQCALRLISRQIRVTDTIFISYGDGGASGIHIEGFARPYRNEARFNGCTIISEVTDRMALAIDGARHCVLKNFRVQGLAFDEVGSIDDQQNTFSTESTWDTALTTAGFTFPNERYAVRAGIAVDGYAGTRPGGGAGSGTEPYPVPTLPAYISAGTSGYGRTTSSRIIFDGIGVAGFPVGTVIGPSVNGNQGDYVTFENCLFERNKIHWSVGQSQSRGVKIDKCLWSRCHTVLTNNTHGAQIGRFAASINIEGGTCVRVFNFTSSASLGPIEITGEAEEVHRIGDIGTGGSEEHGWVINRFKFNFRHLATGQYPANVLDCNNSTTPLKFKNCIFTNFGKAFSFFDSPYAYMEDDCRTNPEAPSTATTAQGRAERIFHNGTAGFVGTMTRDGYRHHEITAQPYNITSGAAGSVSTYGFQYHQVQRDFMIPLWSRNFSFPNGSTGYLTSVEQRPHYTNTINNTTTFASGSRTDRVISGTDPTPSQQEDMQRGGQPGDVYQSTTNGTVLRVDSKDYGTGVTSYRLLTNIQVSNSGTRRGLWTAGTSYSVNDIVRDGDSEFFICTVAGVASGNSTDLAGGSDTGCTWVACNYELFDTSFDIASGSCHRASLAIYTLANPLFLTSTASSNTLTSPKTSNGANTATLMGEVVVEDAIKSRTVRKSPTNTEASCEITVNTAGTSFTLAGNALISWTDYEQIFFVRKFA